MRCRAHNLALGPDGQCVLCRRAARSAPPGAAGPRTALFLFAGAFAVLLVLGGVALAVREPAPIAATPADPPAAATLEDEDPTPTAGEPGQDERPRSALAREAEPGPSEPEAAAPPPDPGGADAAAPAPPPPSEAEIMASLRSTPVMMFTTAWCGVCERARAFFRANQVPFRERDIDQSAADRQELLALTGKTSIPYIDIDGQRLSGFSEASASEALRRSVERRLGVQGLRMRRAP